MVVESMQAGFTHATNNLMQMRGWVDSWVDQRVKPRYCQLGTPESDECS